MPANPHQQSRSSNPSRPAPSSSQKAQGKGTTKGSRVCGWGPKASPATTAQQHDTLGTLRFDAWGGSFLRAAWRPILARLRRAAAACMAARRSRGRSVDFVSEPMHLAFSMDRWDAEEMRDENHIEIERLLSPEDVARACGLSRRAIYRAIARGELRAAQLCHRLRVHPAELERWIAEETRGADPPTPRRSRRRTAGVQGSLRVLLDEGAEG
jgi:excisionase family DNA binding protein